MSPLLWLNKYNLGRKDRKKLVNQMSNSVYFFPFLTFKKYFKYSFKTQRPAQVRYEFINHYYTLSSVL